MSRQRQLMILVAVVLLAGLVALFMLRGGKGADASPEVSPTAVVTLAPIRNLQLESLVSVYGVVQPDPAGSVTVAAPKASIVSLVLVRSGQTVSAGQALMEIANAPGAELAYRQASDAVGFARTELARVQRLYDERLAASDQLTAAKKTVADSQAVLDAQKQQGSGRALQVVHAPKAGVVTAVSAAAGDHVAQDAPLVVLARADRAMVKLGLEPSGKFAVGQAVTLKPVFGGPPVVSRIAMVGRAADQLTKTLDAIVPLNGASLPIGAAVEGQVVTGTHAGKVVPRNSVVFDETGPHIFLISGGKAHRAFVGVGLDQGKDIEIIGQFPTGSQVAVEGAFELQDGMTVTVRGK
ncbi:efflux RND transporter periplasmic adaptor subunit [Phenylobacterium sp.]|uniref:efflux RND transporter periplasmic adaptor subunit n=1 Tax=Phenylobacterium sp. TaxID=1871053 RepID=UPI00286CD6CC|nr:efflux RND transporter periplasmic adaptor subunit [Phenylobacterium sp.]